MNDDEHDKIVYERYNFSKIYEPRTRNLRRVQNREISILTNRYYVQNNQEMRDKIFAMPGNVFSNPIEIIAEKGWYLQLFQC